MKNIVMCKFCAYRTSEEQPYPVQLCSRIIAISFADFVKERKAVGELILKEYQATEVSCERLYEAELYEGGCNA